VSESRLGKLLTAQQSQHFNYPFTLDYNQQTGSDGSISAASTVHQGYSQHLDKRLMGIRVYNAKVENTVDSADTLVFNASGALASHSGQQSAQTFDFRDSLGGCYRTSLTTKAGALASYDSGKGCMGGSNHVSWFAHPDGSPDSSLLPGH